MKYIQTTAGKTNTAYSPDLNKSPFSVSELDTTGSGSTCTQNLKRRIHQTAAFVNKQLRPQPISCSSLSTLRCDIWDQPTSLDKKLAGSLDDLKRTAQFIERSRVSVWCLSATENEEEEEEKEESWLVASIEPHPLYHLNPSRRLLCLLRKFVP